MKNILITLLCMSIVLPLVAQDKIVSGVYVGGHIRRERPETITTLRESGFTYVLLFNVHVDKDGTLKTDGETICKNGEYVFDKTQPNYVEDVRLLKTQPTGISRIEIVIGGWENDSYNNIKSLIEKNGTGRTTMLYRNFKALLETVPGIDAVNNDDEQCYDVNTATKFHVMMYDLGLKTTLAPYTYQSFWTKLATEVNKQRRGAVDRVMVQCYDGGAWNDPLNWNFPGIERHAGRTNYQTDMATSIAQMQTWKDNGGATGGFVWVYNDETWDLNQWAANMNRIFGARTTPEDETVVQIYSQRKYGGYCINLPVGRHTKADLSVYGMPAKTVASLKVKEGYRALLYTMPDFTGLSQKHEKDREQLVGSMSNAVCSIIVEKVESADGIKNSAAEQTTLRSNGGEVTVTNARGQMLTVHGTNGTEIVRQRLGTDNETLPLGALPHGIYIVRVGSKSISIAK